MVRLYCLDINQRLLFIWDPQLAKKHTKGRPADITRVMRLLQETEGLSNSYIRSELNLTDTRYGEIKKSLLDEGAVAKYRCRGGGIRLTPEGEASIPIVEDGPLSTVKYEKDLYAPLVQYLEQQSKEDEIVSIAINTANLRTKGKWQNPDVTQITLEKYPYLRASELIVKTFEVKQWGRWDVGVAFESAAHRRFSHEAVVVLEWPNGNDFSLTDPTYKIDEISRECRRFGLGLYTLRPYYKAYRLHTHIQPIRHTPTKSDTESWLEYIFDRMPDALIGYKKLFEDS